LYDTLKAFATGDPDKNGKHDTIGLAVGMQGNNIAGFKDILVYYGGPNEWELRDGKLVPSHMTQAYLDTMKFYKKLYDEKIINQDFAIVQDGRSVMNKGQAGLWIDNMLDGKNIEDNIKKVDPNAKINLLNRIAGPSGDRTRAGSGYLGMYMIPKTSVKTEAELQQILAYFDKVSEKDNQNLMKYGIEGTQYTLENGAYTPNGDPKVRAEITDGNQFMILQDGVVNYGTELEQLSTKLFQDNATFAVPNPAAPFISNTDIEKGKELSKIIADATVKFIMGSVNEGDWSSIVDQWLQSGGSKVIEEMNAEYAKLAGK
ncbi:sugar ABC transporter permease, partial [Paenibacillus sp. MCAF20]